MKIRTNFSRSTSEHSAKQPSTSDDLGFGTRIGGKVDRLINPDGSFNIERRGRRGANLYQSLVEMSWARFWVLVVVFYFSVNIFFAVLLVCTGLENLAGVNLDTSFPDQFLQALFFSIQTFTTVGYGGIHPIGLPANIIASFDALFGLLSFALVTGLFFARFSRPKAQILFSSWALITPFQEGNSFQFRIANRRDTKILNVTAKVTMTWIDQQNGGNIRRFASLPLERDQVYLLPLNWTLVHPIRQDSPLFQKTPEQLQAMHTEFLVLVEGHDETFAQTVHTNHSYTWKELIWNQRFAPMYHDDEGGKTILELDEIDSVRPLEE